MVGIVVFVFGPDRLYLPDLPDPDLSPRNGGGGSQGVSLTRAGLGAASLLLPRVSLAAFSPATASRPDSGVPATGPAADAPGSPPGPGWARGC